MDHSNSGKPPTTVLLKIQSSSRPSADPSDYSSSSSKFHPLSFIQQPPQLYVDFLRKKKTKSEPAITKIQCNHNMLAAMDAEGRVWVHSLDLSVTEYPVSLSKLVGKKIVQIILTNHEILLFSKKKVFVVNWVSDHKQNEADNPFKESTPIRTVGNSDSNRFTVAEVPAAVQYFSGDHTLLQQSKDGVRTLRGRYPVLFRPLSKVVGMSASTNYCLCWDSEGRLYSWGRESIGLGHQLLESSKQPRVIEALSSEHIVTAHCYKNYSIAMTATGSFFEWGIPNDEKRADQAIYVPQIVKWEIDDYRCILFRGYEGLMGVLTIQGSLYLWGDQANRYCEAGSTMENKPNRVTVGSNQRIVDFAFSQNLLAVVCAEANTDVETHRSRQIRTIREMSIRKRFRRQQSLDSQPTLQPGEIEIRRKPLRKIQRFKTYDDILMEKENGTDCHPHLTKKKKFMDLYQNEEAMLRYVCSNTQISKFQVLHNYTEESALEERRASMKNLSKNYEQLVTKIRKGIDTIRQASQKGWERTTRYIRTKEHEIMASQRKQFHSPSKIPVEVNKRSTRTRFLSPDSYANRLGNALSRKQQQHEQKRQRIFAHLLKHDEQSRRLAKEQQEREQANRRKQRVACSIATVLSRQYLIHVLLRPIVEARICLIDRFSRGLSLERGVRTLQRVFLAKRTNRQVKQLPVYQCYLVHRYFRKYSKRFAKRRTQAALTTLISATVRYRIRDTIKFHSKIFEITARKLQKLAKWHTLVTRIKLRALIYRWNLLLINGHILRFKAVPAELQEFHSKQYQQMRTYEIYNGLLIAHPHLKLREYLDSHPIFRINFRYLNFIKDNAKNRLKRQPLKETEQKPEAACNDRRSRRVQFMQRKLSNRMTNLDQLNVFPFSKDYLLMVFPLEYQLRIPERTHIDPRWQTTERDILHRLLRAHLDKKEQLHRRNIQAYDGELGQFIRKNYALLCQRRAKYIMLFNTLKHDDRKKRMMRELTRLLKKSRCLELLQHDILPQKHAILEQALKLPQCPNRPAPQDFLSRQQFRQLFEQYYHRVQKASKHFQQQHPTVI